MSSWNDYQPEESVRAQKGKYRVEIVDAEEAISKSSGLPMFVITVKPNPTNIKVKTYLVKNDKFNANATKFFDAFGITRGDFNCLGWIGAVGAGDFDTDENGYLNLKWWLSSSEAAKLPAWVGEVPERQTITDLAGNDEPTPFDELPD